MKTVGILFCLVCLSGIAHGAQVEAFIITDAPPSCLFNAGSPRAVTIYRSTDPQDFAWYRLTDVLAGDAPKIEWVDPAGQVRRTDQWRQVPENGTYCYSSAAFKIAEAVPPLTPGTWTVKLYLGTTQLATRTFTILEPCRCSVSPTSFSFEQAAGSGSVVVTADPICQWTASTSANWIFLTSGMTGTGNGTVRFNVGTNTGSPRTGTLIIGGQTVTVTQNGSAMTVSPSQLNFAYQVGGSLPLSQLVVISGGAGLAFTATTSGGNWLAVSPAIGTVPASVNVSVSPAGLGPGTYNGTVTITAPGASNSPQTVAVTLTVTSTVTIAVDPDSLSFNFQAGGPQPPAQSLAVSSTGGPANFTATSSTSTGGGWLSLSPLSGTTPASLSVSVSPGSLPPGEYSGTVTVTSANAGNSPRTVGVRLVISSGSMPAITAVVNAGSALPTAAAPGLVVSIFGTNLGSTQGVAGRMVGGVLETTVAETRVLFDNNPAPLLYVRADQINAIVPYAVAGRFSTQLQTEYRGNRSSALTLQVVDAAPGIFTLNNQGTGQGAILNQDYSVNGSTNAAARDSVVMIYATGEGQTAPSGVDGKAAAVAPFPAPVLPVRVTIGGRDAEILYAGTAPGFVAGAMQINVRIPRDSPTGGQVAVMITIGGRNSQNTATLVVR